MRIGGIASGMDTQQMVKDLMRAERVRVDKYFRQEESLKWKRQALNTTNKTLAEFILKARSDFGLSRTTSTGMIMTNSTPSFDWVKKVSSSNESAVKATATASAMEGTHKIEVAHLAEVASVTVDNLSTLMAAGGDFKITVGKDGTETANISVGAGATMTSVVKLINDAIGEVGGKSLGIRAAYDASIDKLIINTKQQGKEQAISISGIINVEGEGKDAQIWFNESNPNQSNMIEQSSNNFSMFGVNYQLQATGVATVKVESNVSGIMDKVKNFVADYNAMIDNLNGQLQQKSYRDFTPLTSEEKEAMKDKEIELWEEKARSGLLRNDETLTRVLQTMRSSLYESVYNGDPKVEGTKLAGFNHITQLGITTGNYQSGGKLEINEDKLRAAINENPDGVVQLLFKTSDIKVTDGDATSAANKRANTGLVERLFGDMVVGMKEIVRRSGTGENASLFRNVQSNMLIDFVTSGSISVMDRDIMGIGTRIAREERILMGREDRYWRQFTAMEKALEKMNQQSGWLMAQLGQMG